MGRSAKFDDGHFVAAAQEILASQGPSGLTVQKIAAGAGGTTGSVYHRFASLDVIAAEAWLQAAEAFQADFIASLAGRDPYRKILAGALHTPVWSRRYLTGARVLLRMDASQLDQNVLANAQQKRIRALGRQLRKTLIDLVKTTAGSAPGSSREERLARLQFLLVDMPLAAVKPYLKRGQRPPASVDEYIEKCLIGFRGDWK